MVSFYTLLVIELSVRCVYVCGSTVAPDSVWMKQMARTLTYALDGICLGKTHLIIDRDTKYTESFKQMLKNFGVESVLSTRENRTNWDAFLKAHWDGLLAADFFTTEFL